MVMSSAKLAEICLEKADIEKWTALQQHYEALNRERHASDDKSQMSRFEQNYSKYFDLERWLTYHARHVIQLELHIEGPKKRTVDIGCGSGIFSFICKCLGHESEGLDIDTKMYQDMAAALGVHYNTQRVTAFEPLPGGYENIDVFTAIATKFDRMDFADLKAKTWSVDAWRYFLTDLAGRLTPDGIIYLKPNSFTPEQFFELPEVGEFLMTKAVKTTPSKEFFFTKDAFT